MIFRIVSDQIDQDLLKMKLERSLLDKNLISSDAVRFINSPQGVLKDLIQLESKADIRINHTIYSNRKIIGKAIVFIKRVIRKFTRFFVAPIVNDQNAFNKQEIEVIRKLTNIVISQQQEINALKTRLNKK